MTDSVKGGAAPLSGIRIADFSRVIAGPLCAMTLADLGADVVKIENPEGGDDTRGYRPPDYKGLSPAFLCYNRNKRSITLDLNSEEGVATARALIDRADMVIENFRTGLMERYGLDYATVSRDNPRLIYLSVSAYGRTGPFKGRAGYDPVVQAESGFMSMTGDPDRPPVRTGMPMIDVSTGMTATQAALAALIARDRFGVGQHVEVPLFDTGFSLTGVSSMGYLASGVCPERTGNGSDVAQPLGVFEAADGPFLLAGQGDRPWRKLVTEILDRPDLLTDPDFGSNAGRVRNRVRLHEMLNGLFASQPREHWISRMRAAGVPVGAIRTIEEGINAPETRERGIVRRIPHAVAGEVPDLRSPLRLSRTPVRDPVGAPYLGQHNDEIRAEWLGGPVPTRDRSPPATPATGTGPLTGIKVVDFTRIIAGPHCAMTLGDLGADVLKIENPEGGDDSRGRSGPRFAGDTAYFLSLNRNKRSVTLDLSKPEGRAVARELIARADVVIENFSTGVMAKFGLDYESVSKDNPRLVYCSISGYGRDGAYASRAGYDPVAQAESGFMSINGYPDRPPYRTGIAMIDLSTGLAAAQAVLAALYEREHSGQGQYVDAALYDVAVTTTFHFGMSYLVDGRNPTRVGNGSPAADPIGVFEASDGPFQMTIAGERVWKKLVFDVLNRPDIAADPRFEKNADRVANREALRPILDEIFARDTRDNWVEKMRAAGAPAGPIRTIAEAVESPEVRGRELITTAPHSLAGTIPSVRNPMRFSATPIRAPVGGPVLGEHTETALAEWLGYDAARLGTLREAGAFGKVA